MTNKQSKTRNLIKKNHLNPGKPVIYLRIKKIPGIFVSVLVLDYGYLLKHNAK